MPQPRAEPLQAAGADTETQRVDSEQYFTAPPTITPAQQAPPGNPPRRGRYAKSEVSFGLTGRVVLTVLLLLPLAWFVYLATHYFIGIGGIVVYGGVVIPWALRDLWRPHRR